MPDYGTLGLGQAPVEPPLRGAADTPLTQNEQDRAIGSAVAGAASPQVEKLISIVDDWEPEQDPQKIKEQMVYGVGEAVRQPLYPVIEGQAGRYFEKEVAARFQRFYEQTPGAKQLAPDILGRVEKAIRADLALERRPLTGQEKWWTYKGALDEIKEDFRQRLAAEQTPDAQAKYTSLLVGFSTLSADELYQAAHYMAVQYRPDRILNSQDLAEFTPVWYDKWQKQTAPARAKLTALLNTSEADLAKDLLNRVDVRRTALKAKDVGILDHDPLKEGIYTEDAGRYSKSLFLSQKVQTALVREAAQGAEISSEDDLRQRVAASLGVMDKVTSQLPQEPGLVGVTPAMEKYLGTQRTGIPFLNAGAALSAAGAVAKAANVIGKALTQADETMDQVPYLRKAGEAVARAVGAPQGQIDAAVGPWELVGVGLNQSHVVGNLLAPNDYAAQTKFWEDVQQSHRGLSPAAVGAILKSEVSLTGALKEKLKQSEGLVQTTSEDLGRYLREGATDQYGLGKALRDTVLLSHATLLRGFHESIIAGLEKPEGLPFVMAGEAWVEPRLMDIMGKRVRAFDNAIRGARYQNLMAKVGELLPSKVRDLKAELAVALEGVDPAKVDMKLVELNARAQTLIDLHGVDGITAEVRRSTASQFARSFRAALPSLDLDKLVGSDFARWIDDQAGTDRGAFGWKNLAEVYKAWRGSVPAGVNRKLNEAFSYLNRDFIARMGKQATELQTPGSTHVALKAQAAEAAANGDTATFDRLMQDVRALEGTPAEPGPGHKQLLDLSEVQALSDRLRKAPAKQRPVIEAMLRKKTKDILGNALPDGLDMTQLRLLDEAAYRPGKQFWDSMQQFVYKVSGKKLFSHAGDELNTRVTMARRLHDWFATNAVDYYADVMSGTVRKLRLDHLYRFALNKAQDNLDLLDAEKWSAAAAGGQIPEGIDTRMSALSDQMQGLKREWRNALTTPPGQTWRVDQAMISQHVSPDEIAGLMSDAPELWNGVSKAELSEDPRVRPDTRKAIKKLFEKRSKVKREVKALESYLSEGQKVKLDVLEYKRDMPNVAWVRDNTTNVSQFRNRLTELEAVLKGIDSKLKSGLVATRASKGLDIGDPDWLKNDLKQGVTAAFYATGKISIDTHTAIQDFIDLIPNKYFKNMITMAGETNPDWGGSFSPLSGILRLMDSASPQTFFHEFGHNLIHLVLDSSEIQKLWKMYVKDFLPTDLGAYAKEHPMKKLAERIGLGTKGEVSMPGPEGQSVAMFDTVYADRFTEWFARSLEAAATRKFLKADEAKYGTIFKRAWGSLGETIKSWLKTLRGAGMTPAIDDWFNDLLAGKIETYGGAKSLTRPERIAREKWFQFWRDFAFRPDAIKALSRVQVENDPAAYRSVLLDLHFNGPMDLSRDQIKTLAKRNALELKRLQMLTKNDQALRWFYNRNTGVEAYNLYNSRKQSIDAALNELLVGDVAPQKAANAVKRLLSGRRFSDDLADAFKGVEELKRSAKAYSAGFPNKVDPLSLSGLSFWNQSKLVRSILRSAEYNAAEIADRLDRLAAELGKMDPEQVRIVKAGLRAGGQIPRGVSPTLDMLVDEVRTRPYGEVTVNNLKNWLLMEKGTQAQLLETAHEAGFLDDQIYQHMKARGYSPHLYGIFERPRLVTSGTMTKARRALKGSIGKGEGGTVSGIDGSELAFARDLNGWRVFGREADGKTHDYVFQSRSEAEAFTKRTWDEGILDRTGPGNSDERRVFRSLTGESVSIAEPIGKDAITLDLLTGQVQPVYDDAGKVIDVKIREEMVPQARLEAFARLNRDLHAYSMLEMLREFGLVKSPVEIMNLAQKRGGRPGLKGFGPIVEEFVQLPDDKAKLGDMAGQYVHPRVLTELNNMSHTYDQLRAWFDGIQEIWSKQGLSPMDEATNNAFRGLNNVMERVGRVVKTTQILANQASYVANFMFDVTATMWTSGAKAFHPSNFPFVAQAARDIFGGTVNELATRLPKKTRDWILANNPATGRSVWMQEAIEQGIINGAIFERTRNPELRKVFLDLAGMTDEVRLRERLDQLQGLLSEKEARLATGRHTRDVELEIVAIEEALNHQQRPYIQKIWEKFWGAMGAIQRNRLGLPASKFNETVRGLYSKIDDFFKLFNYTYLRNQGLSPEKAAWNVKSFMQDYANVPATVQWAQRSPFGALVPSFAYELMRIGTNLVRYRPHRILSTFGAVYAFNQFSAVQAGVHPDRVDAMDQATGNRNWLDQMIAGATHIYQYDPYTKERIADIDLSDTLLPLMNFTDSYSAMGRMADSLVDRDDRTAMQGALAMGLKVAGNFVGGQPVFSWTAALMTGRDPVTGKLLLDKDVGARRAWDYAGAFHKVVTQSFIPPALPGGRMWSEVQQGIDRPLNPSTGRPYGGRSAGSALINGLMNIKVRGWPAAAVSEVLGAKDKPVAVDDRDLVQMILYQVDRASAADPSGAWSEMPMFGASNDKRFAWAKAMGESDPTKREQLRSELKKYLTQQDNVRAAGVKAARTTDAYDEFQFMKALDQRGATGHFDSLPVFRQTVALMGMDSVGVSPKTIREYEQLMITAQGRDKIRVEIERNPYAVANAISALDEYKKARPGGTSGYQFENLGLWLRWTWGKAYSLSAKEMAIYEARRLQGTEVK